MVLFINICSNMIKTSYSENDRSNTSIELQWADSLLTKGTFYVFVRGEGTKHDTNTTVQA